MTSELPRPDPIPSAPRRSRVIDALTLIVLVCQVGFSIDFARTASVTHDEYWHLPVGVLHWKTGRFDWERLNPPLGRMLNAIPVVFSSKTPAPAGPVSPGEYGDAFVRDQPDSFRSLYVQGRFAAVFLSLLASLALAAWARAEFGSVGALLAAVAWCLSPNTIAHGSLVTTDMSAVLGVVVVLRRLQRFLQQPTWRNAIVWGTVLGLAQGLKYTCLLLYPLSAIGAFLVIAPPDATRPSRPRVAGRFLAAIAVSFVVLNAIYLFQGSFARLDSYQFGSRALQGVQKSLAIVGGLPVPLPSDFLRGIDAQRMIMEQAHPVFLDGEWGTSGFRSYYLKALLYKVPLGTLALFALACLTAFRDLRDWRRTAFFLLPAAALIALASFEDMQLGLRYILPAIALASLFLGRLGLRFGERGGWILKGAIGIAAVASLQGLRCHPYELAYFNELAGGPERGVDHLVDSNLDWGQDLDGLKAWLDQNPTDDLNLAYFGTVRPEVLGIRYHVPPSFAPRPGLYAVSANFVAGRPHAIPDGQGGTQPVTVGEFSYLRFFRPRISLGHSILIYRLTESDVARWENAMQAARGE